jgi:uncharacterized repeat protein (TIGR01451 family)
MSRLPVGIVLSLVVPVLFVSCVAPVVKPDYLYIPVVKASSGTGVIGNAAFDRDKNIFNAIERLSTVAFYKGDDNSDQKRAETNGISFYSARRQELTKFKPNSEDLLLIKTSFKPGRDYTAYTLLTHTEYAFPDDYIKDIDVDIEKVVDGNYNMDFAIVALNLGSTPIKEIKIIDCLPEGVEYVNSRYATKDDFIPLNADLASVAAVRHKVIKERGKTILVFDVESSSGIDPAAMVEILVNVNVKVSAKNNKRG